MSSGQRIWFLSNLYNNEKYDALSTRRTRDILRSIPREDKVNWVLWTDGWRDWAPLTVVEATGMAPELFFSPPENYLVEMTRVRGENTMTFWRELEHEFSVDQVKVSIQKPNETPEKIEIDHKRAIQDSRPAALGQSNKRTSDRMDMRLEVIIFGKKSSFRCRSVNISMGGVLLDMEIPKALLLEPFEVVIVNPLDKTESLKFEGQVVGDTTDRRRLKFTEHKGHSKANLEALLAKYKSRSHYAA